ncbi:hypothetical protein ACROYT_G031177 [Oculina patagonica]
MKRRAISIGLITFLSLVQIVLTSNNTFTFGLLNGYPAEFEAINFFANHTSRMNNISVALKRFQISERINIFNQG